MSDLSDSASVQACLNRLAAGEVDARQELIQKTEDRLVRLARKMLRQFPVVRRWEMTDDLFQNSVLRIHAALREVTPPTVADFMRFAAFLIRRELIDLSRHYSGPHGIARNHHSDSNLEGAMERTEQYVRTEPEVQDLARWTEFHEAVGNLPDELRAVFEMSWYQELPQTEIAALLGVSERTVQRRWLEARLSLHSLLKENI